MSSRWWSTARTVDFTDAATYYRVSTVNYLAAGSCNFNDGGVSLWPLNQIVNDTQYYVRDAVIDYITAMGTVLACHRRPSGVQRYYGANRIRSPRQIASAYYHWIT